LALPILGFVLISLLLPLGSFYGLACEGAFCIFALVVFFGGIRLLVTSTNVGWAESVRNSSRAALEARQKDNRVIGQPTARACGPTTAVTRDYAEREKLPLSVAILPLGDGTVEVKYEVILTGPFANLRHAEILVLDGDQDALRFPIAPAAATGAISGHERVKGHFQIQPKMLRCCRVWLYCSVEPLSLNGSTFVIDLPSYLK
jgi:hypothetical protein